MSDKTSDDRPALPRDAFRAQRTPSPAPANPVVITPAYDDPVEPQPGSRTTERPVRQAATEPGASRRPKRPTANAARNPFEGYGERSSSRPYALRLPDAIDLVLRQMAAEERTHPLRVVDRILHDHLKRIGRLPPQDP